MNIEPGKDYRTRDGRKAHVVCDLRKYGYIGSYPFYGVMDRGAIAWMPNGSRYHSSQSGADLVDEWREPVSGTAEYWIALLSNGETRIFVGTPVVVGECYSHGRIIGRKKVTVTVTEGDKE